MARHEGPREDLLAEAVALVERMEIRLAEGGTGQETPVVVGFRKDGCASFYFDQDPVYQFNTAGELRRLYVDGLRYKADGRELIALEVSRDEQGVGLAGSRLSAEARAAIVAEADRRLDELERALAAGQFTRVGQIPAEADLHRRTRNWLAARRRPIAVADAPHAR